MPEAKPTNIRKLGKRGKYAEGNIIFHKTEDNAWWEIRKQEVPEQLRKVNSERSRQNRIKNQNRDALIEELTSQGINKKEATRSANLAIEGEYKERKGQPRPVSYNFKNAEKLKAAREAYQARKKLDEESREKRRGEDRSDQKIYDYIRQARKQRRSGIYIYGENELPLSKIQQITDTGKVISADKTPLLDTTVTKNVKTKQKDINGNPIIKTVKKRVKGKDGARIVAYRIPSSEIVSIGNTATVAVSNIKRPKIVVERRKITKRKAGNKIIFKRIGNQLVTGTQIDRLFLKTEERHGSGAAIYLDNKAFQQIDFVKVKGGWALTSAAQAELDAPEYEGKISVRFSQIYRKSLVALETRIQAGKPEKAEKALYGEIRTSITLGGTVQNVTILIRSKDAYSAIKQMAAANKKSGAAIFCVVATDFTATKQGNNGIIELGASLREGNALFLSKDTVQDKDGNLVGKYKALDHYLVISWIDGYFVIQVKSLQMVYGGLTSDEGDIVHR